MIRIAGVAACACLGLAPARAENFDVVGQCRAGVPNGAYELKMSDGRMRVVGAFTQGRMTGTFIFWSAGGARQAVVPLDNDARSGTMALWYTAPDGHSEAGYKLEAPYVEDEPHGIWRSFYPDGARETEARYEHGQLVAAQAWSEEGMPLSEIEARRLAVRSVAADEQSFASLVAFVRQHLPVCEAESTG